MPTKWLIGSYLRVVKFIIINRQKIASIVFNDKEQLDWINETTHPILLKHVRQRLVEYQNLGITLVILDVPLLYEAGWDKECDEVWVVHLKYSRQITRLMERNNLTLEEAESRIKAQISGKARRKLADVVIDNNGYKSATQKQIRRLIRSRFPHLIKNYKRIMQRQIQKQIERLLGID